MNYYRMIQKYRILLSIIFTITIVSITAAGSGSAAFSLWDSFERFFGKAPIRASASQAQPSESNRALTAEPSASGPGIANYATERGAPQWLAGQAFDVNRVPQFSLSDNLLAGTALSFNGNATDKQRVTFGAATGLGVTTFTLEAWVNRAAGGVVMSTGSLGFDNAGGRPNIYPVVTKGMGEGETPANVNMNYFLGITSTGFVGADFEDKAGGVNHPAWGTTSILAGGGWHHIAATYSGTCWALYVDGNPETLAAGVNACPGATPESISIQHAGLAASLNSAGVLGAGFFSGVIDEARIWNRALAPSEISTNKFLELTSGSGLLARWGLNEGSGTTIASSVGTFPGTVTSSTATLPTWVGGFPLPDLIPPVAPTGLTATPGNTLVALSWTANSEGDLAGYNVYRSTTSPVSLTGPINGGTLVTGTIYNDTGRTNGQTYYYVITAVDASANQSGASNEVNATPAVVPGALQFTTASGTYVTFGDPAKLDLATFTIETWFKRTGAGTPNTTGSGGITSAIPLVTHGSPEGDGSNVDADWILVIDDSTDVIAADFEDSATGLNHPVSGITPIINNVWYHAAATYDGTTWRLYLNGNLETTLVVGAFTPRSDSIQQAGLGTMIRSNGTANGFYQGVIDESRVWNVARTQSQIMTDINSELTSGTGLVARWGLNEGTGTVVADSIATVANGTITGANYAWVTPGAPFNIAPPSPPAAPTLLAATATAGLQVDLAWTDNSNNETSFKIERSPDGTEGWTQIDTTLANVTAYSNTGLNPGTFYCYRVRASNGVGDSDYSNTSCATTPGVANNALNLGSGTAYTGFGDPADLDLTQFTIETWFKRTGAGTSNTTGTGGVANAIPLVTHGAPEAEGSSVDANWVLVIDDATDVIAADFEDTATGANHPVLGVTPIADNTWHHAAATYDGTTWQLYLDGALETTLVVGATPRFDSTQLSGLGAMFTTTGTALGHFNGTLDEVRVWNYARTQGQIQGTINSAVAVGQAGLVARWGLDETTGPAVPSSAGTVVPGTITGAGYSWVAGAPAIVNHAPQFVSGSPADLATNVSISPTLTATVTDHDLDNLTVQFYGRPKAAAAPGADFSIIALPDTQYYTGQLNGGTAAIFNSQTQWVVDNKTASNIAFVTQLGDCTENGNVTAEWQRADTAFQIIENPGTTGLTHGIPYGIAPGNHDQFPIGNPTGTAAYNTWFGEARFLGRSYYQGHYGTDNDNHYEFFSASGLDFIIVHLEWDPSANAAVLAWANALLQANPNRRAIVVTHWMVNGGTNASFSAQGQAIYNALKGNSNLFLLLGGHVPSPAEGRRSDTYLGNTVNSLLSDYQGRTNGGNGWMRIMTFSPLNNTISVKTYSPWLNQFETDADSQFTLSYNMSSPAAPFELIGTDTLPNGGTASVNWDGRTVGTEYEWYVTISDTIATTTAPTRSFTTVAAVNQPPVITEGLSTAVTMSEDGSPTAFSKTLNATDANIGDTLTWSISGAAAHGTATASGTGLSKAIGYTPAADYNGSDSFVVQVSDGNGGTDTITVNVTVDPVNDAPVCLDVPLTTSENMAGEAAPSCTDVDSGDMLTYSIVDQPTNGLASVVSGNLNYVPAPNYIGSDAFTYRANDGTANSNTAAVSVTISPAPPPTGLTCTVLQPKPLTAGTGEKPQSKVWNYDGAWYAIFPTSAAGASTAGTWLWKLQGTTWTESLKLSNRTDVKADAKSVGNVVHALLDAGASTELVSAEYVSGAYQLWTSRPAASPLALSGSEIATIDIDSTGRMWLATENDGTGQIVAYYSDSPYSSWSAPITLATGVNADDISVVVKLPNKMGVLWSNQNTRRFGFRVHDDTDTPSVWAADEVPASQSAQNVGLGMADDHLNVKVASDGTLYAAAKTSYDTGGYPKMALLVRRPAGAWDDLYTVDTGGTRGNIELDEVHGVLTYLYTQSEGFNPIVYRQSNLSAISFGARQELRSGSFNDVSSTKQNYNNELAVIYGSSTEVSGQLCAATPVNGADLAITKTDGVLTVQPNETLTYTVVASNSGPLNATGATVTDTMPAALTNVNWTCSALGGASCSAGGSGNINDTVNLPVGGSVTYTITATVVLGASGTLVNTATVAPPAGTTDPITANNSAADTDSIGAAGSSCGSGLSLVGCWQMEEGSGTLLVDGSSFTNNGNITGTPIWAAGKVGTYALDLDGSTQYAAVPDDASLDLTNSITVAAWVKPEIVATQDLLKKAVNGGTNGFELSLSTSTSTWPQKVFFRINQVASGDTYRVNSTSLYPIDGNTWMHVAATFDGTALKLYINGQLESTTSAAGQTIAQNALMLGIGAQSDGARKYKGWMDDARIYNRALTATEIAAVANVTVNRPPDAPTLTAPGNGSTGIGLSPALDVIAGDPDFDLLRVTYYGRPLASGVFTQIGENTGVVSGDHSTVNWAGLGAGQTYEWYATVSDGTLTTTGPTWTFHTDPGTDPIFVGVGDIAACNTTNDTATGNIVQGVDGVVFTTGDNVYYDGTAEEYADCYAPTPWGSPTVKNRTRPIAGNHDWGLGTRNTLEHYFNYFGANATDAGGNSYYSYDIGANWHVVNIDTECALVGGCNVGSPQEVWLKADLAANSAKNVIAIIHKPRYSSGSTNLQTLQPLWDAMYAAGVDILLDGHDHIYERFTPMKSGATLSSPPVADPLYGIHQFTVGMGGESHHGLGTTLPTSVVRNNTTYGIFKLTLRATTYDWKFLPIAGDTFTDSGTGTVHGAPIVGQAITVTTPAPVSAVYDTAFTVAATSDSGLPVAITTSGVCSVASGGTSSASILMTSGTGTCTVRYNQAGDAGHSAAPEVTSSTTALKAPSTVTVAFLSTEYEGIPQTTTAVVSGVGTGITQDVTWAYSGSCSAAPVNVSDTPCTATATYAGDANHTGNSGSNTITITQRPAAWTTDPNSKTFGNLDPIPLTTGNGSGFLPADAVTATYGRNTGESAGSYHITATLSAAGDLGNYAITNPGADFTINARTLSGTVNYALNSSRAVPDTTLAAAGPAPLPAPVASDSGGDYSMSGFGTGTYTITPSKPGYPLNVSNGIFANDASLISQHVVHQITLTPDQIEAGKVSGLPSLTSFDAALIAQYIVGIPNALSQAGTWKFKDSPFVSGVEAASVRDFSAILKGDVSGDWPAMPMFAATELKPVDPASTVWVSVPNTESVQGSIVTVPLRIDNLNGQEVGSYQFDIEYDPAVIEPVDAAASLADPLNGGQNVVSNAPVPGLLKVVVYGAVPVTGDGVYVNLRFTTLGAAGSTSPLNIRGFRLNDGLTPVFAIDGILTVTAANDASIRGRLLSATGQAVQNARIVLTSTAGDRFTAVSNSFGYFEFSGLLIGETYTAEVRSKEYRFSPRTLSVTGGVTILEMTADQ